MGNTKTVPFFNYPHLFAEHEEEFMSEIRRVLACGRFILQEELEQFERSLARFAGVRHAIGVGNGTDALLLALRAAGVGAGDEVIMPSHTFVATASSVHHVGAEPVLVDVRDDHTLDPSAVRAALSARTKAIVPVQLNGRVCAMDEIGKIAKENGLLVVEDAAQALGAMFEGVAAGGFGVAAGTSFYPAKLLGCFGDGGAVLSNDDAVAERVGRLRDHGRMDDGSVSEWSYNSRLDNMQAAVLNVKLRHYAGQIERRREIADRYDNQLRDLPSLLLPPPPTDSGRHYDVFQNYEIEADRRDDLRDHLAKHGIGTIVQWGGRAVHQFPRLGLDAVLPVTDRVMSRSLLLPMNTSLADTDVDYVCECVRGFLA